MAQLKSHHLTGSEFTRATVQKIHADWATCIGRDVADYERIYQDHLANLRGLLSPAPPPKPKGLLARFFGSTPPVETNFGTQKDHLYRFAICFGAKKYLTGHGARQAAHQQLNLIHDEHLALIDQLLDLPDRILTDHPLPNAKGTLGEAIEAALHVYFHHTDHGPQSQRLRTDASLRIPKLLRRYPYLSSNITASMLDKHPDLVAETASLIHDTFRDPKHDPEPGLYPWIARDMTGFHARREDPYQKQGPKIMAQVLANADEWPQDQLANLAQVFVLRPLDLSIGTAGEETQKARDAIAREEALIANGFTDTNSPLSPQQDEKLSRNRLKSAKARLAQIETDFDSIRADHVAAAAKHLAKANGARKTVEIIAKPAPNDLATLLTDVLALAQTIKDRPQTFPMPKASDNRFKDLGLKLMVIDELMYTQKRLLPAFDIRQFAKEWTKREISIEDDGYDIIPEAQTYFKNLAIPDDLLAHVEVLTQKSGLDGGGGPMDQMMPFWDPGAGDWPLPVTNKAVADLDLLPNLKCVVGLEHEANTPKPAKLLKELDERRINTVEEELSLWGPNTDHIGD